MAMLDHITRIVQDYLQQEAIEHGNERRMGQRQQLLTITGTYGELRLREIPGLEVASMGLLFF
jgi:hypothetical protein